MLADARHNRSAKAQQSVFVAICCQTAATMPMGPCLLDQMQPCCQVVQKLSGMTHWGTNNSSAPDRWCLCNKQVTKGSPASSMRPAQKPRAFGPPMTSMETSPVDRQQHRAHTKTPMTWSTQPAHTGAHAGAGDFTPGPAEGMAEPAACTSFYVCFWQPQMEATRCDKLTDRP